MSGTGEKNLQRLLRSMQPALLEGTFAYVTVATGKPVPASLNPLGTFREPEGMSLLVTEAEAMASRLPTAYFCRCISLNVHSSLYAIGFLAVISDRLAKAGMSINIISAFHRDYLLVPTDRADEALAILRRLTTE